jgi:hypothetical protein
MSKWFFDPSSVPFHQCIGGFEQLAHDCDESDLGGFSGLLERCIFCLEVGVEAHDDQGGRLECIPEGFAATADE